jgi:biopolymer transport protein ExbD
MGIPVLLPTGERCLETDCDGRAIWIKLLPEGQATINGKRLSAQTVAAQVGDIMQTRAERVVYLTADPEVDYSEVLDTISGMRTLTDHLAVMLVTPKQLKEPNVDFYGVQGNPETWIH